MTTQLISIKSGFILREVGGRNYVVAVEEASKSFNGLIKLNDTAKHVWQLIAEGSNEEQIVLAMQEKYQIEREEAQEDLRLFLDKLVSAGVLELTVNE